MYRDPSLKSPILTLYRCDPNVKQPPNLEFSEGICSLENPTTHIGARVANIVVEPDKVVKKGHFWPFFWINPKKMVTILILTKTPLTQSSNDSLESRIRVLKLTFLFYALNKRKTYLSPLFKKNRRKKSMKYGGA